MLCEKSNITILTSGDRLSVYQCNLRCHRFRRSQSSRFGEQNIRRCHIEMRFRGKIQHMHPLCIGISITECLLQFFIGSPQDIQMGIFTGLLHQLCRHVFHTAVPHTARHHADSAENIKAIQTLYDTEGINFDASIAGGDEITLFRNGTLQMAFCWNIAQQLNSDNNDAGLTNSGDEIMPMAFPTASGDPKLCGGIWGFGVFDNGDEAKVKAAKTFIEFIAADPDQVKDSVLASTYFPVRASVGDIYADNAIMSEYTKFMAYLGDYYQITPGWATARTEWWNMLQRVGTGEDVATSVATFVQNANAAAAAEA